MHFAYYSPAWPPSEAANGVVTYVAAMADYLRGEGHRVSVVTLDGVVDGDQAGLSIERSLAGGLVRRVLAIQDRLTHDAARVGDDLRGIFAALHRRSPIDLIEMEESFGWFGDVAKTGVPVVVRLHGPHFRVPRYMDAATRDRWSIRREARERKAIGGALAITSPSQPTLAETCERYRCATRLRRVIANPVAIAADRDRWSAASADRDQLLWIGQFEVRKGPDLALQAFSRLAQLNPHLRMDMVGPDYGLADGDGPPVHFAEYCERHIDPAVRARVRFHGRIPPEQIAPMRRRAALALVTSRSEVYPYIIAEAFAAGLPVLTTPWPGVEDIVTDETGWIARDMSADALAAKLQEALDNPAETIRRADTAWAFANGSLSASVVGAETLDFYQAVLSGAGD